MTTLRSLGKWWVIFAAFYLILTGISLLFSVAVPAVILGILALVAGILALFAT